MEKIKIGYYTLLGLMIVPSVHSSLCYAALADSTHMYIQAQAGKGWDVGAKTLHSDLYNIPRITPKLWAVGKALGLTFDLSDLDRLGVQVGHDSYGVRKYIYDDFPDEYITHYNFVYSGYSALLVGSHLVNEEHRYSLQAGIQRSIVEMEYKGDDRFNQLEDERGKILVNTRYEWQPRVGLTYEYLAKPNASITFSFHHTWGRELDDLRVKTAEPNTQRNIAKRAPGFTAAMFGLTLYV